MSESKNYWLVKSEPEVYAFDTLVKEKQTAWTGVRNYAARLHLRAMKKGDILLYYHSGDERMIVGLAKVTKAAYPDPTANDGDWSCVDISALKKLSKPVSLDEVKKNAKLKEMALVRISRLSVQPVREHEFETIMNISGTKI
jgi:predicted RNA-binding protein with PUA-like domain